MHSKRQQEEPDKIVPVFSPAFSFGTELLQSLPSPELVPAKTVLLTEGRQPNFVRLLRSGIVKLSVINEGGEESLLGLRSEGWWAGAPLALLGLPSLSTATTITPCSFSSVPVDEFSQKLMANQRILRHFILSQCRELMVEQKHGIMQGRCAAERLNYLQRENRNSLWRTIDPASIMRQGDIAKLLAITPEHLSRLLHSPQRTPKPQPAMPSLERLAG